MQTEIRVPVPASWQYPYDIQSGTFTDAAPLLMAACSLLCNTLMTSSPIVHIIIPAYNAERFLAETLQSVQAQTRPDWQLLLIDDGSKDGTVALAQKFAAADPRIRVVAYENGGVVVARNRGFAETSRDTPYIAYLDHDDLWEPDFLASLLPLLEQNPTAAGAHGIARFIDEEGKPCEAFGGSVWPRERSGIVSGRVVPLPNDAPTSFAVEVVANCIATPGQMIMRRASVEAAGLFHPDANPCDDWDLYLRLTQRSDILFLNKIVMGWRQHGTNVSKDWERMERMMRYVRRKLIESADLSPEQRRLALIGYRHTLRQASQIWLQSARACLSERKFARAANHTRFALQSYARSLNGHPTDAG